MKFKKKPVVVEAFQYDGDLIFSDGTPYAPEWAMRADEDGTFGYAGQGDLYIGTPAGELKCDVGDYIVKGVNGELYPVKPDIFEQAYELVN